jgi:hypothetical protein
MSYVPPVILPAGLTAGLGVFKILFASSDYTLKGCKCQIIPLSEIAAHFRSQKHEGQGT